MADDNSALERQLTTEAGSPATNPYDPTTQLGPDVVGLFGQLMGQAQQYAPNREQIRYAAQEYHGISSEEWAGLSQAEKNEAIDNFLQSKEGGAPYIAPSTIQAQTKAEKKKPKDTPDLATQIANALAASGFDQVLASVSNMMAPAEAINNATAAEVSSLGGMAGTAAVASGAPASVVQALSNYDSITNAGALTQDAALGMMGKANMQYLASAPLQPYVNLLTQGLGSGYYKQLPSSLVAQLPPQLQQALQSAGVGIAAPQTWPKQNQQGINTNANALASALSAPSTQSTSNPNTPGS